LLALACPAPKVRATTRRTKAKAPLIGKRVFSAHEAKMRLRVIEGLSSLVFLRVQKRAHPWERVGAVNVKLI
jgi:hypothetical protein